MKSPPPGISLSLESDNLHVWEAVIEGPPESLYKGVYFRFNILFFLSFFLQVRSGQSV